MRARLDLFPTQRFALFSAAADDAILYRFFFLRLFCRQIDSFTAAKDGISHDSDSEASSLRS